MLALPPSDPSLYEISENGVVFLNPLTLAHIKVKRTDSDEESKSPSKRKSKKGKKGKNAESSDEEYDDLEEQKQMKDKFPTAALAIGDVKLESWADLKHGKGKLAGFITPKDLV